MTRKNACNTTHPKRLIWSSSAGALDIERSVLAGDCMNGLRDCTSRNWCLPNGLALSEDTMSNSQHSLSELPQAPGENLTSLSTTPFVPAARSHPSFATFLASDPDPRGGRSADRRTGASAPVGPAHDAAGQALARRLASLSGGTRASRRSTLAIFGFGSALPSPALPPEMRAASSSQHGS